MRDEDGQVGKGPDGVPVTRLRLHGGSSRDAEGVLLIRKWCGWVSISG